MIKWVKSIIFALLALIASGFLPGEGISLLSKVSIALFTLWIVRFILDLGDNVPLKHLMMLIAILQWLIGPIMAFYYYPNSEFYYMIVDENTYMSYVLPAIIAFMIGLLLFGSKDEERVKNAFNKLVANSSKLSTQGYILVAIGIVATLVRGSVPGGLKYLFVLLSYLRMIGAFYIYVSGTRLRWLMIGVVFSFEVLQAFGEAMFHDMLLWAGYLFLLYAFISKISLSKRLVLIGVLGYSVFLIQSIKADYREVVWENRQMEQAAKLSTALDIAGGVEGSQIIGDESAMQSFVDRINQGWIIARIIYMVPGYEPFAGGETVSNALEAALVPRILNPKKAKSGGKENFTRFTGIIVDEGTSMDLSTVGEAYANYGLIGGIIMMFVLGIFYSGMFRWITFYSMKYPELVLWLPFVFFYTVKAENDLATALNQMIKSLLVMVIIIWGMNKLFSGREEQT